ncbi:DUF302 domain-containing protein [Candidatus Protochlamydia phocaeensis]|uniref:DUF302 domain-containing protein n=1 Tax=Candidatus Protochlamydia phocaeensis TaxID=1414722 RepID=UPI0008396C8C|nr:DUF302 domain-containing protein [Candidatus Protochlamydia phocaeensis]
MEATYPFSVHWSPYSVAETVQHLDAALRAKGTPVFALIDHSGEASRVGLSLADEKLLIFGDPKVGTFLMQENPAIGFDLPLKVLVWKDASGSTQIAYTDPSVLKDRYHIEKNKEILEKMAHALSSLINEVIK